MNLEECTVTRFHIGLETSTNHTAIHPMEVIKVIRDNVNAGTFLESKGLWRGETENSVVFECLDIEESFRDDWGTVDSVEGLKKLLEDEFDQDSVLVTRRTVEAAF